MWPERKRKVGTVHAACGVMEFGLDPQNNRVPLTDFD